MSLVKSIQLEYRKGTSDKVYVVNMLEFAGTYVVHCEYGRRGQSLRHTDKGTFFTVAEANLTFDKIVAEKVAKGYKITFGGSKEVVTAPVATVAADVVEVSESLTCEENSRESALARLKAASVW